MSASEPEGLGREMSMDDLISREKLKRKFCGHCVDYGKCEKECFDLQIINSMPTEDKKGKWLHPYQSLIAAECSVCHVQMPISNYFYFCPHCGARMEESDGRLV